MKDVHDRYYFSAELNDLKNLLCWTSFFFSSDSFCVSLSSTLRGWGTCRHSNAQVK